MRKHQGPFASFTSKIRIHVFSRHDADDITFPGVAQTVGPQDTRKHFVPGRLVDIDVDFTGYSLIEDDILIRSPGQCAQQDGDIDVVHFKADLAGGKRLGDLGLDLFFLFRGSDFKWLFVYRRRLDRRSALGLFRLNPPLLIERVLDIL